MTDRDTHQRERNDAGKKRGAGKVPRAAAAKQLQVRRPIPVEMTFLGGALAEAAARHLAATPPKQTKSQLALSYLADVLHALHLNPTMKVHEAIALLAKAKPEASGSGFVRDLSSLVRKYAEGLITFDKTGNWRHTTSQIKRNNKSLSKPLEQNSFTTQVMPPRRARPSISPPISPAKTAPDSAASLFDGFASRADD